MSIGVRILVIEDSDAFRRLVRLMLSTAGYDDVQEAADGDAGLASYRQQRSDVVITDILMPGMEGLETIRALRKHDPQARIIAMSGAGRGGDNYLHLALRFGAQRILIKPFTKEELLESLREVLASQ